jgi:SAM-dependent methyltransferase
MMKRKVQADRAAQVPPDSIPVAIDSEPRSSPLTAEQRPEEKGQARAWSRHARHYDDVFLNPYRDEVENPLWEAIDSISDSGERVVADLGCGTGPLLPILASRFAKVIAVDFSAAMLRIARERLSEDAVSRVRFLKRTMAELDDLEGQIDVAVAVNSLVMPDVRDIDRALTAIHRSLVPGGLFLGIVPSMDAIHYHTMLLYDQALQRGLDPEDAERDAAIHAEHVYYDFTFGRFLFQGLQQKFWQPFELEYHLQKAGFSSILLRKVLYPWDDTLALGEDLAQHPRSWDWFFQARAEPTNKSEQPQSDED